MDDLANDSLNLRSGKASASRIDSALELIPRFVEPDGPSEDKVKQNFEINTQSEGPTLSNTVQLILPRSTRASEDVKANFETP